MRSFSVTNEMGILKFLRVIVCLGPLFELRYLVRGGLFGRTELIPILLGLHLTPLGLHSGTLLVDIGLRLRRRGRWPLPSRLSLFSRSRLLCLGSLDVRKQLLSLPVLCVPQVFHRPVGFRDIAKTIFLPHGLMIIQGYQWLA